MSRTETDRLLVDLAEMLSYRRPAGSRTERKFRRRYLLSLPGAEVDPWRNIHVRIARPDGTASAVLWSAHTDTVHRTGGRQIVAVKDGALKLSAREKQSNCLGADNGAGVWLLREMIRGCVPGHYVFHHCEERGGIGSADLVKHGPALEWLGAETAAIAFDRRGKQDVITFQGGKRCCSDAFAASLAALLPAGYRADDGGVFTDTANYVDRVAECTNVSVGYANEHRDSETQAIDHVLALRERLLRFDESQLTIVRKPGTIEYKTRYTWSASDWDDSYWRPAYSDRVESRFARRLCGDCGDPIARGWRCDRCIDRRLAERPALNTAGWHYGGKRHAAGLTQPAGFVVWHLCRGACRRSWPETSLIDGLCGDCRLPVLVPARPAGWNFSDDEWRRLSADDRATVLGLSGHLPLGAEKPAEKPAKRVRGWRWLRKGKP